MSLKLNEEIGHKEGMAADYGDIGGIYQTKGNLDKALEHLEKSLKMNIELGRKEGISANYTNIGTVYKTKGEFDKALEYYKRALENFKEMGRRIDEAIALVNIGDLFVIIKAEKERAIDYYLQAQELASESPPSF